MTKGADGTTRVISQPIAGTPKSSDGSSSKSASLKEGPQKVQILRAPDGKISVRGLLQGQQLIQMPDGKLHIVMAGQQGLSGQLVAASSPAPKAGDGTPSAESSKSGEETKPTQRIAAQSLQQVLVGGARQVVVQTPQVVVASQQQVAVPQQVVVQAGARPAPALAPRVQALLVQRPLTPSPVAPRPAPPRPRQSAATQQIVVNNPALVQQIAAGKIQLATVNGQQVLIRPTGNNQAQIVAHIGQSPAGGGLSVLTTPPPAPVPRVAPPPPPPPPPPPQQIELSDDELVEKRLLVGQPPGTVIKTVTAQVNYYPTIPLNQQKITKTAHFDKICDGGS